MFSSRLRTPLARVLNTRGYQAGPLERAPRIIPPSINLLSNTALLSLPLPSSESPPTYNLLPPFPAATTTGAKAHTRGILAPLFDLEQRKLQHIPQPATPILVRDTHRQIISSIDNDTPAIYIESRNCNYGKTTTMKVIAHYLVNNPAVPVTSRKLVIDLGPLYPLLRRGRYVDWVNGKGTVPDVSRALLSRILTANLPLAAPDEDGEKGADLAGDVDASLLQSIALGDSDGASLYDEIVEALQNSSPTAACELLARVLDGVYTEGNITRMEGGGSVDSVVLLDGVDSSSPLEEGYVESRGSKTKRDVRWHGVYYIQDYAEAELAIPVGKLAWLANVFEEDGSIRMLPGKGCVVASGSLGDYPVPDEVRNEAHMRARRKVQAVGGEIVQLRQYDEGEYLAVMQGYMAYHIGVFAGWNKSDAEYDAIMQTGGDLDKVMNANKLKEGMDIVEVRDMGMRCGLVPGEVMKVALQL